jgi:predicted PurR-regulated permease PerM
MSWSRRGQVGFWLCALAVFFLALYLLSPILPPFVAGGILAYFLDPAVSWLVGRRVPRWLATVLMLALFVVALVLLGALIVPLVRLQAAELIARLPALFDRATKIVDQATQLAATRLPPADFKKFHDALSGVAGGLLGWGIGQLQSIFSSGLAIANILSLVIITPIVAFFLLRDWPRVVAAFDRLLPRDHLATIREQARQVDATLGGYIRGQLLVCFLLGLYYATALTVVGLDFSVILGILTGLLAFIPYLGFAIGLTLSAGFALLQFGWSLGIVWVALVFALGALLESSVLSPKIVGDRVRLHPLWIIFALFAFGALFGFVGILVALPAAAVTGVLVRFGISRYMASRLYDGAHEERVTKP